MATIWNSISITELICHSFLKPYFRCPFSSEKISEAKRGVVERPKHSCRKFSLKHYPEVGKETRINQELAFTTIFGSNATSWGAVVSSDMPMILKSKIPHTIPSTLPP
jgi:hypothetical protein